MNIYSDMIIVGIDGGATKISALPMDISSTGSFKYSESLESAIYSNHPLFDPDFSPVNLETQFSEMNSDGIKLQPMEQSQGRAIVETAADLISNIFQFSGKKNLLIGIGFPGIKMPDKRGIAAIANGPRMPFFLTDLEKILSEKGVNLKAPIGNLGSDADFCGIGEENAAGGKFHGCENAYYFGAGTGVADALKLKGELVPFDAARSWIAKTWEFATSDGLSFERYLSANGIQYQYSKHSGIPQTDLINKGIYLDQILELGLKGINFADTTIKSVIDTTCRLIYERITTIYSGFSNTLQFVSPDKIIHDKRHPFIGTLLDRIVFGQRSASFYERLLENKKYRSIFLRSLGGLVQMDGEMDKQAKAHYLDEHGFKSDLIHYSGLRHAPAVGAGIERYKNYIGSLNDQA